MSKLCVNCLKNEYTGPDLSCDKCRDAAVDEMVGHAMNLKELSDRLGTESGGG